MSASPPTIMQFSFVVRDIDQAIKHWASKFHVGPFFVMEHVPYKTCLYKGEETDIDMTVAMAYRGDIQIELVQQHNDAPSIFNTHLNSVGEGLQHMGAISDNLQADLEFYRGMGITPIQEGEAENGVIFAYLNSDQIPGTMLELVSVPDKVLSAFEYMKAAATKWNPAKDSDRR